MINVNPYTNTYTHKTIHEFLHLVIRSILKKTSTSEKEIHVRLTYVNPYAIARYVTQTCPGTYCKHIVCTQMTNPHKFQLLMQFQLNVVNMP